MDKFKKHAITFSGLALFLFFAFLLSMPRPENRFQKIQKREDRLVFSGQTLDLFTFSHPEWIKGFNGQTGHVRIQVTTHDGSKGFIYLYVHSLHDFTDYSFYQELLEIQVKYTSRKGPVKATYVDGFKIGDNLSGVLLDKVISLGPLPLRLLIRRDHISAHGAWVPETQVEFQLGETSLSPLTLNTKVSYQWDPEEERKLWLGHYDPGDDSFTITDDFRADLF